LLIRVLRKLPQDYPFCPATSSRDYSEQPSQNKRFENSDPSKRLGGAAFEFRDLINYTTRALFETAGFRPQRHFNYKDPVFM